MAKVDELDLKLLSELKKDGSISIPLLAKKLNISCPGTDTLVRDILKLRRKLGLPNNIGYYFKDLDIKIEALMKNIN